MNTKKELRKNAEQLNETILNLEKTKNELSLEILQQKAHRDNKSRYQKSIEILDDV